MRKNFYKKLILISIIGATTLPFLALAQTQIQISPEVTLPSINGSNPTSSPAHYVQYIFLLALGIAGALAFAMIVVGGMQIALSGGNTSQVEDGKDRIRMAILGLLLLLFSYLILKTINPNLVNLQDVSLQNIPAAPGGGAPSGGAPNPIASFSPTTLGWDQGWTWTADASAEKGNASPALQGLLSCMGAYYDKNNIPRSSMTITSISDINIQKGTCFPSSPNTQVINGQITNQTCTTPNTLNACFFYNTTYCQHHQYSCHYGGPSGGQSYAFDAVPNGDTNIYNAAHATSPVACGAHVAAEGTHDHVTIGFSADTCDIGFGN